MAFQSDRCSAAINDFELRQRKTAQTRMVRMKSTDIPEWIARWIRRTKCIHCRRKLGSRDLFQFCVSLDAFPKSSVYLRCSSSKQSMIFLSERKITLREAITRSHLDFQRADQRRLVGRSPRPPCTIKTQRVIKPKLTETDERNLKKLLDKSQTHDDFLRSIGMSQEEIDRLKNEKESGSDGKAEK